MYCNIDMEKRIYFRYFVDLADYLFDAKKKIPNPDHAQRLG